jgi:hypothetical protein
MKRIVATLNWNTFDDSKIKETRLTVEVEDTALSNNTELEQLVTRTFIQRNPLPNKGHYVHLAMVGYKYQD